MNTVRRTRAAKNERGQVVVMMALLLPVFFGLAAVVMDIGNWYVHKRHLQTQVDAAALASAPAFAGCFHAPAGANLAIAQRALEYAGDTAREPATTNLQVQEPNDVRVVLNGDRYWVSGDPVGDDSLDNGLGMPCDLSSLDVKATDDDAPLLWGLLPLSTSPKSRAKIEIRQVRAQSGMLPWAVPELDPRRVVALFVNEDNGQVFGAQMMSPAEDASLPWSEWATDALQQTLTFDGLNVNTGVIILVSKDDPTPQTTGTLAQICGQSPGLVRCYGGQSATSGISFIHGFSGGFTGSLGDPQVREVRMFPSGCTAPPDSSAPHFTLTGDPPCSASIQMVVDFGIPGVDPAIHPHCVRIPNFTWSAGGLGGANGTWSRSIGLPSGSGRQTVSFSGTSGPRNATECGNPGQQPNSFTRNKVHAAYVANAASGPVQYLQLQAWKGGAPIDAYSIETTETYDYRVVVGLPRPLSVSNFDEDPIVLRMASVSGSQNQAFDCDRGVNYRDEIQNGCQTTYKVNYDDHDGDGDYEWRDIYCTGYGTTNLPPATFFPDPIPDCVITETGDMTGPMRDGATDRFGPPNCVPNNWPTDQAEADIFFGPDGYDFASDPRYVTLIVTDDTAFTGSGNEPLPIKYFAGFYVVGWDYHPTQSPGCPDNAPHPIYGSSYNHQIDNGDAWGYFVNIVVFSGAGDPSDNLCAFGQDPGVCIAVLVE